jgi:hypothetical protein
MISSAEMIETWNGVSILMGATKPVPERRAMLYPLQS